MKRYKDFPKEGILYRDALELFKTQSSREEFKEQLLRIVSRKPTTVVGIDSRGYVLGTIIAELFGAKLLFARKKGKAPGDKLSQSYQKEYGFDVIEMTNPGDLSGEEIIIADDLLATGGTFEAVVKLVEQCGVARDSITCCAAVSISECNGEEVLNNKGIRTIIWLKD